MRRQAGTPELLDGPLDARTLRANLRDLARVNRWLGGVSLSVRALRSIGTNRSGHPLRLLDVGTGGGDIPARLVMSRALRSFVPRIKATDVRPEIVDIAKQALQPYGIRVRLALPDRIDEPDDSFDVVHSSMVLHHAEPDEAVALLREMARVASRAVIVNDLDRRRIWWIGSWLLAHIATLNRYTRHDGPLSVLRAYRPKELVDLASQAGLVEEARFWARPRYRYAITFRHAARADA